MARKLTNDTGTSEQKYSVNEIAKVMNEEERKRQIFAATKNAVQFIDLSKTETRSFQTYSKDLLRTFMTNPKNYESRLRGLSQFLYRVSYPYRRIIDYYSNMIDTRYWMPIAGVDIVKNNNDGKILKEYGKVVTQVKKMNMPLNIPKILRSAWLLDLAAGYAYEDNDSFYLALLDPDYIKISSVNYDGTFNIAFDFSYFRSREYLLPYYDKEFQTKYNAYSSDSSLRWQELDNTKTCVIKINDEDPTLVLSPFIGLFEALIDLADLASIQSVKNELSSYKMLIMEARTLEKATEPDSWAVDLD